MKPVCTINQRNLEECERCSSIANLSGRVTNQTLEELLALLLVRLAVRQEKFVEWPYRNEREPTPRLLDSRSPALLLASERRLRRASTAASRTERRSAAQNALTGCVLPWLRPSFLCLAICSDNMLWMHRAFCQKLQNALLHDLMLAQCPIMSAQSLLPIKDVIFISFASVPNNLNLSSIVNIFFFSESPKSFALRYRSIAVRFHGPPL